MAGSKGKTSEAPAEALALYEAMVASCPEVERKGATMPFTSVNGNMFSVLHPSGAVALRLPPEARATFLAVHNSKLFDAYGVVQKEYVTMSLEQLRDPSLTALYFSESFEYSKTLKPKKAKT